MQFAIKILKKELKNWSAHYESEKIYYKGEENDSHAIYSFRECREKIMQLQEAIRKLEE